MTEQVLANPDLTRIVGEVLRAEVERAVLAAVAGVFRTLADELPHVLARAPASPLSPLAAAAVAEGAPRVAAAPAAGTGVFSFDSTTEIVWPSPESVPAAPPPEAPAPAAALCPPPREVEAARAHCERGAERARAGDLAGAVGEYDGALRLDPNDAAAYLARGQALRLLGRLDDSAADFLRASELDRDSLAAHQLLAQVSLTRGRWEEAVAACTVAIRLDPARPSFFLWRGLAHAGQGDNAAAVADADRALGLNPTLAGAYLLRARARAKQGRNDEAIADLTSLLALEPGHTAAYHARGLAQANTGRYDLAVADYNRALRLKPKLLAARFHRALAYRLKGEYAIAVAELGAVIQARPDHAQAHYHRALAHQASGQDDLALADLDRALELDPDCEEARWRREEVVEALARRVAVPQLPAPAGADPARRQPEPTPKPTPKPTAANDTGPAEEAMVLVLTCPGCGAPARINWKRLDRLFKCRRCGRLYRVNGEGHFTQVDTSGKLRRSRQPVPRWLWATGAGVCLAVCVAALAAYLHHRASRVQPSPELPTELQARSELFARGWLENDRPLLRRLTAPTDDRQLHPWLERHRPPARLAGDSAATGREGSRDQIDVRVANPKPHEAVVTVRITGDASKAPLEVRLNWVKRGETWYFLPR
ncbi:MAG TPA: tetratricopeptide repeat protein [Gemmataceae bacterium]|nr:tetratricopeptide repeat protein [Gemmataceae bacterium]